MPEELKLLQIHGSYKDMKQINLNLKIENLYNLKAFWQ